MTGIWDELKSDAIISFHFISFLNIYLYKTNLELCNLLLLVKSRSNAFKNTFVLLLYEQEYLHVQQNSLCWYHFIGKHVL